MFKKIHTSLKENPVYTTAILLFSVVLLLQPISSVWINLFGDAGLSADIFGGLIVLVTALSFFRFIKEKRAVRGVDTLFLIFGVVALLSFLWSTETGSVFLVGLRYSLLAISGYFIGRVFFSSIDYWDKILKFLLWFIVLVSGIQLFIYLFGGESFLVATGLGIEHFAGSWPRLSGPFPGPNQMATFLTISALWLYWRKKINLQTFLLASTIVVLTFSRSAILGLLIGYLIPFIFIQTKKEKRLNISAATIGILLLAIVSIYFIEPLRNNFIN